MTSLTYLLLASALALSTLASCTARVAVDPASGGSGAGTTTSVADAGAYSGTLVAEIWRYETTSREIWTNFTSAVPVTPYATRPCPSDGLTVGSCCWQSMSLPGLALPGPRPRLPNAGAMTLTEHGQPGVVVASLIPVPSDADGMNGGEYSSDTAAVWTPGDSLDVSAAGDQVRGFTGVLQTGTVPSGVIPSLGPTPILIDRTQPFTIAWNPEGQPDETVILELDDLNFDQRMSTCSCVVPDRDGTVTVDSTLLTALAGGGLTPPAALRVRLERVIESVVSSDNATVRLVSDATLVGNATLQ